MTLAGYRLEVILPFTTGLPRDIAVNTFNVVQGGGGNIDNLLDGVMNDVLPNFYISDAGTSGAISSYISSVVSRVENACTINAYHLEAHGVESGPPVATTHFTMGDVASSPGADLPNQITACASLLSTHNDLITGTLLPLANRRGRLYLGPLVGKVLDTSNPLTVFSETFTTSVCDQCAQLAGILDTVDDNADGSSSHFSWVVVSKQADKEFRTVPSASPIGRGWCDNRIDTQRRRQEDATRRSSWTVTGGVTP